MLRVSKSKYLIDLLQRDTVDRDNCVLKSETSPQVNANWTKDRMFPIVLRSWAESLVQIQSPRLPELLEIWYVPILKKDWTDWGDKVSKSKKLHADTEFLYPKLTRVEAA